MNTSLIQPSFLIYCLGWTLLHFVWQGSLIAVLLRTTLTFVPGSQAKVRYFLCYGALLLCVFGFVATLIFLTENQSRSATAAAVGGVNSLASGGASLLSETLGKLAYKWETLVNPWIGWIVMAWLLGLLAGAIRFSVGLGQVRSLVREARSLDDVYWLECIRKLSRQLGIDHKVRVVCSVATNVPLVIGLLKPTILLPISLLSQLSTEQIECIVAHELAHIRRCDYLANICQVIIESVLFYHPAVWWIGAEIRREREYCCDDLVLSTHTDAVLYAKALATLEQSRAVSLEKSLSLAASDGPLIQRIRRIVSCSALGGQNTKTSRAMRLASLTRGAVFLVLTPILLLVLTLFNSTSFAQTSVATKPVVCITSDRQTYKGEVATADDKVVCRFQDYTLMADHLTYNRITKTIQGTGHAKFIRANGNTITASQITIPDCTKKSLKVYINTRSALIQRAG